MSRPRPTSLPDPALRKAIEHLAASIGDPGAKLQFIQRAIDVYDTQPELLRKSSSLKPIAVRLACFGAYEELRVARRLDSARRLPEPSWTLYRARHAILGALIAALGVLGYAYGPAGYRALRDGVDTAVALLQTLSPRASSNVRASAPRDGSATPAVYPSARVGKPPEQVWLVEDGPLGELWSNGLRVLTSYRVSTQERRYLVFPKQGADPILVAAKPAGIVYHTSESDIAPFEPDNTNSLLRNTRGLLRWLRNHGNYHYLIDRFGRRFDLLRQPLKPTAGSAKARRRPR